MKRIKVLFVLANLRVGGAQRVTLNLVKHLDRARFDPKLVVLTNLGEYQSAIPADVPLIHLNRSSARYAIWDLVKTIKKERPDIIYSVLNYVNCIVLAARWLARIPCTTVISEHSYVSGKLSSKQQLYWVARVMRWLYPKADKIVCVSQAIANDLQELLRLPPSKMQVIHNPVVDDELMRRSKEAVYECQWFREKHDKPVILAVGSLRAEKGFDYLLEAFALVRNIIEAKLVIIGEGEKRRELENLIHDLDLDTEVALLGYRNNPYKFMANADVFVLSSLVEGLPTVLIEAMACGVPVVATDCPSGPREIITHGENGLLVLAADPEDIAKAILRVLEDRELATKLTDNAKERAGDFNAAKITRKYETLFMRLRNWREDSCGNIKSCT